MISKLIRGVPGDNAERELQKLRPILENIKSREKEPARLSESELKQKSLELKARVGSGESPDQVLPEAFALFREAAPRTVGLRPYDVQLLGAIVLHKGAIAEMKTGEGKTLCAAAPLFLGALAAPAGSVHMVTLNDYLARRDAERLTPLYEFLGLRVAAISNDMKHRQRLDAYSADIVYGANQEFGFDYLRNHMAMSRDEVVGGELGFALIDEVDSILIDEARTPLIISGSGVSVSELIEKADHLAQKLIQLEKRGPGASKNRRQELLEKDSPVRPGFYFDINPEHRDVDLREPAYYEIERLLGREDLYNIEGLELLTAVNAALRARLCHKKDVDYPATGERIIPIDKFTGRPRAIERAETYQPGGLTRTLASITPQNYFSLYHKTAGMTGTALDNQEEFESVYGLRVFPVPTHRPVIRKDLPDKLYLNQNGKNRAIVAEIKARRANNQPILIGTPSVEKSEELSGLLLDEKIPHNLVNAKQNRYEAEIIAEAGRPGVVTIATNMAGRGTDIIPGGSMDFLAQLDRIKFRDKDENRRRRLLNGFKSALHKKQFRRSALLVGVLQKTGLDKNRLKLIKNIDHKARLWRNRNREVLAAGGLFVLGYERHEARRIDKQLLDRAGRQGDPGAGQFFLSLDDDLLKIFTPPGVRALFAKMGFPEDSPLETPLVLRSIQRAQRRIESYNFDLRKHFHQYDFTVNVQRTGIQTGIFRVI